MSSVTSSGEGLLLDAVRHENATTKQGLMQKLFAVWFDAFVYNQIWEDPRVDLQALKIDSASKIITISSGGCNALNYLAANPESVTAADLNRHHIYLARLKVAALHYLPTYEDFFNFFGHAKHPQNVANYRQFIAPNLDAETRRFWESNGFFGNLLHGERINFFKLGLYNHARNGYFLRFFHRFAKLIGCDTEKLLAAKTIDEQEAFYAKNISPFFDSFVIRTLGRMPITMFGLGIPPQQYAELKKDNADVISIYRERAHRLACGFPIQDNYFAWQAFARKYDTENHEAIPEYLKRENYAGLKANARRVQTEIASVTDVIKREPVGSYNRFVFLDAQDWMTDLWSTIAERGGQNSRIIFRTAGAASPIETALPPDLREKFIYEKEFSAELFKQDRASIYGGFHLYILK